MSNVSEITVQVGDKVIVPMKGDLSGTYNFGPDKWNEAPDLKEFELEVIAMDEEGSVLILFPPDNYDSDKKITDKFAKKHNLKDDYVGIPLLWIYTNYVKLPTENTSVSCVPSKPVKNDFKMSASQDNLCDFARYLGEIESCPDVFKDKEGNIRMKLVDFAGNQMILNASIDEISDLRQLIVKVAWTNNGQSTFQPSSGNSFTVERSEDGGLAYEKITRNNGRNLN